MAPRSVQPVILIVEPFGGSTRLHNPNLPMVYWDDAAVTRGDGVFETLLIRDGNPVNIERHVRRFLASATLLGLPEPDLSYWHRATDEAAMEWYRQQGQTPAEGFRGEAQCVWTYTRGRASTGNPTAWIRVNSLPAEMIQQREQGVAVMTTPRGWTINTELPGVYAAAEGEVPQSPAPWLTVGAKTLNYAAAMAALRYAKDRGFDDVVWLGADGESVLEGATSTVVMVKKGKRLCTPSSGGEILPGTTQAALFDYAHSQGWKCKEKPLTVTDLKSARSVWLLSSVRGAVPVTRIDDTCLEPHDLDELRQLFQAAMH
ncbi:aminodeoxychorismate lyase [Corynebacterium sp. 3HC-13]|uniref:aminodeoxychorismate lyase n=1 Tax=Corynebacterium poyangense TaxID=2684405 RepID=UPI001CCB7C37|nr:aminodeoxychorismate lyase [Corynebacterium poyangense]MBZ8176373.1 aminodeoxychorismate lyase [Corynebacterium poyangense]